MKINISKFFKKNKNFVFLGAVILLAVIFRFAFITTIPAGIHPDAATNAIDAYNALIHNDWKVFYEGNAGREGLFINLISFSFLFFGVNFFSYKAVGALVGVGTVLGMYFLGKEISRNKLIGLLASFFTAISFWLIVFDRTGFRASLSVLAVAFTLYFFIKALRTSKWYDYAAAGFFLGIGFHTYIAFRLMPVVIVLGLAYRIFLENRSWKKFAPLKVLAKYKNFIWLVVIAFLVSLPLFVYFYQHPESFVGRTDDVSVLGKPNTVELLTRSMLANLGMFNFFGDPNWRHNISGEPSLSFIEGILFILGFFMAVRYLFRKIKNKNGAEVVAYKTNYLLMIALFAFMILPAGLSYSPGGIPHALRMLDTAPAVFIFMALAAAGIYYKTQSRFRTDNKAIFIGGLLILFSLASLNFNRYFYRWGMNEKTSHEYSENFTKVSRFINLNSCKVEKIWVVGSSIEVEFFTLDNPKVERMAKMDYNKFSAVFPQLVIFTGYKDEINKSDREFLTLNGWQEVSDVDFGQGNHTIKVFQNLE